MSTRANIVIKDRYSKLFFYRHSDGYPEGTIPTLKVFHDWLCKGKIRDNAGQSAGWLVLIGAMEYNTLPSFEIEKDKWSSYGKVETIQAPEDWKCGSYEPTTGIHGDIEYLYVIDLTEKSIKCYEQWNDEGEGEGIPIEVIEKPAKVN